MFLKQKRSHSVNSTVFPSPPLPSPPLPSPPPSLTKKVDDRPKIGVLVEHRFIKKVEAMEVDVAGWFRDIRDRESALS